MPKHLNNFYAKKKISNVTQGRRKDYVNPFRDPWQIFGQPSRLSGGLTTDFYEKYLQTN